MATIEMKFLPRFQLPMEMDIKLMTCRLKKMGEPGDRFMAFGCPYMLTHVFRTTLEWVLTDCVQEEGCRTRLELEEVWRMIHPKMGIDLNRVVWAHCFRRQYSNQDRDE